MIRRCIMLAPVLSLLLASGCAMPPATNGNLYDMRRDAQLAYAANEEQKAENLLLGLSRAAPNDPEAWFYLGNLYARTNRPDQAVQAYQKGLMRNSGDAKAWHNIGVVRLREAWAAFVQAHGLAAPGDPLYEKIEAVIAAMEKIPLEGLSHKAQPAAGAPAGGKK
jgi:tetratricopeptide (TPR) repeat protein